MRDSILKYLQSRFNAYNILYWLIIFFVFSNIRELINVFIDIDLIDKAYSFWLGIIDTISFDFDILIISLCILVVFVLLYQYVRQILISKKVENKYSYEKIRGIFFVLIWLVLINWLLDIQITDIEWTIEWHFYIHDNINWYAILFTALMFFILLYKDYSFFIKTSNKDDSNQATIPFYLSIDNEVEIERPAYEKLVSKVFSSSLQGNTNSFMSFAITGRWGSGKTYLVDKIKKDLSSKNIIISLKPREYKSFQDLLIDFNNILSNELYNRWYTKLSQRFKKSFDNRIKYFFWEDNRMYTLLNIKSSMDWSVVEKETINKLLDKYLEDRRVLIIIDDVDRFVTTSSKNGIEYIYKFVNEYASFDRFTIISLLDITNQKPWVLDKQYYIKFFENIIDIPDFTPYDKVCFMLEGIKNYMKRVSNMGNQEQMNQIKDWREIMKENYIKRDGSLVDQFDSLRAIQRFLAYLTTDVWVLVEANILQLFGRYDLIVINYIKLYDYPLYRAIIDQIIYKEKIVIGKELVDNFLKINARRSFFDAFFRKINDDPDELRQRLKRMIQLKNGSYDEPELFHLGNSVNDRNTVISLIERYRTKKAGYVDNITLGIDSVMQRLYSIPQNYYDYAQYINSVIDKYSLEFNEIQVEEVVQFIMNNQLIEIIGNDTNIIEIWKKLIALQSSKLTEALIKYNDDISEDWAQYRYSTLILSWYFDQIRYTYRDDYTNAIDKNWATENLQIFIGKYIENYKKIINNLVKLLNDDKLPKAVSVYEAIWKMFYKSQDDVVLVYQGVLEILKTEITKSIEDKKENHIRYLLYMMRYIIFYNLKSDVFEKIKNQLKDIIEITKDKYIIDELTIREGTTGSTYNSIWLRNELANKK